MNRQQKETVVRALRESLKASKASFLVDYKGLTVVQMQQLRGQLRDKGGRLQVAKARLMKRAAGDLDGVEILLPFFKEQVGLVFAMQESPAIAKVLHEFSKEHKALELVAGCLEAQLLDVQAIVRMASLPSKEVLLGQVCCMLNAPISGLVRLLNMLILRLLLVLKAIEAQKR